MPPQPTRIQPKDRRAVIELENSSWVVERGVRHTEWFVMVGNAWTRLADIPAAAASSSFAEADDSDGLDGACDRPAGCQYLLRFRLMLPLGTSVRRRVSIPRRARRDERRGRADAVGADLKRDILSQFRYVKPPLAVQETHFRVGRRGLVLDQRHVRPAACS